MNEILYRSDRLEVRRVPAGDGRWQVVTFDSYHEPPGLDRPGFGEAFFEAEGITAIHVMSHGNDWFQYPEMTSVFTAIRAAAAGAERLVTYGSSMGGYAALRFAAPVGAKAALALSPQYSVHPRRAPFETRWAADRRRIRFIKELERPLVQVPLMVLVYDRRLDIDTRHANRLTAEADIEQIPLSFAGHPVGPFLNDVDLLRPLVLSMFDGSFKKRDFRGEAVRRQAGSPHWHASLAEQIAVDDPRTAAEFARKAVSLAPDRPNLQDVLARRLAAIGRYREAIEAHQQAIALDPIPDYYWGLSKTLHEAGQIDEALAAAERLQQLAPNTAGYHAWASQLREALGDWRGAIHDAVTAAREDPRNYGYRSRLLKLQLVRWVRPLFRQ